MERLYVLGVELRCGSVAVKKKDSFALKASMSIAESNSRPPVLDNKTKNPIVVIDNYDSFTYNLCQVFSLDPIFLVKALIFCLVLMPISSFILLGWEGLFKHQMSPKWVEI